jgi:hypothetical protein
MPKKNWKEGPVNLQRRIREWLAMKERNALGHPSDAETHIRCSEIAFAAGYDMDPPVTPILDKVTELRAASEWALLAELRLVHGAEEASEQRALSRYQGLRRWASELSAEELAEKARAEQAARDIETAKERRITELMADMETDAIARRRAAAVKQLTKEQQP